MSDLAPVRSALFVPANRDDLVEKCVRFGADAVVLDLEDATPPGEKERAREVIRERIPGLTDAGQRVWVRVNALETDLFEEDLAAACLAGADVVCVPKVASAADIAALDSRVSYEEGRAGRSFGSVGIYPLLETAPAIADARAVFEASPRIQYAGSLAARRGDVEFELGFRFTASLEETLAFRSMVLVAARAAGIGNPMAGLVTDIDEAPVRQFAEQSRAIGYEGMFVIHPSHVSIANEVFGPTPDEVEWSLEVREAFAAAMAQGVGAIRDSKGRLVDIAMDRVATSILAREAAFAARKEARTHER